MRTSENTGCNSYICPELINVWISQLVTIMFFILSTYSCTLTATTRKAFVCGVDGKFTDLSEPYELGHQSTTSTFMAHKSKSLPTAALNSEG